MAMRRSPLAWLPCTLLTLTIVQALFDARDAAQPDTGDDDQQ